ncbi:MAG TPA: hypothetical protein VF021_01780, partial [Longimicrobiales bacterium]
PYNPAAGRIHLLDLFSRMRENGAHYMTRHLPILLFGVEGLLLVSVLVVALASYGWIRQLRHPGVAELFLPLYLGLLLVWPAVWSGERFLLPALPFLLFYAGDGLVRLTWLVSRNAARVPAAVAALMLIAFGVPATSQAIDVGTACTRLYRAGDRYACTPDQYKDYYKIAELAPRVLPPGSAVLSRKARSFYIIGGVPGRPYPLSDDSRKFFAEAASARAQYVVFDRLDALADAYLAPVLLGNSNAFCIMFALGPQRAALFGINQAAAAAPRAGAGDFEPCPAQYWRNPAVRDSMRAGLIQ